MHHSGRPCGQSWRRSPVRGVQRRLPGRPGFFAVWTGPKEGAVKVANTNGCAATVAGTFFDAAGGAGHQHMPDVALVLMGAGRADRRPPVPAADVGDPVRLGGGVVASRGPRRWSGRWCGWCRRGGPGGRSAGPAGPGRASGRGRAGPAGPRPGLGSTSTTTADRPWLRPPRSRGWAAGATCGGWSAELGDVGEGVAGEPDPDGFGDAVDLDVARRRAAGVGDPVAAGAAVPGAVARGPG